MDPSAVIPFSLFFTNAALAADWAGAFTKKYLLSVVSLVLYFLSGVTFCLFAPKALFALAIPFCCTVFEIIFCRNEV